MQQTEQLQTLSTAEQQSIPPLSQSRYELMACPHLYLERIVLGKREADNIYALRGTQIHAAIADYVNHLVSTRQPSDYGYFDTLLEKGYTTEALEILETMKESFILDPEKVLGVEEYMALDEELKPIDVDFEEDKTPAFEGTADYLQLSTPDTIEIWDWKSFFQIIDADTFQSKFYPLLVFQHYPQVETVRFHLQFVRYGVSRSVEFTRAADLEKLQKLARRERQRQLTMHSWVGADVAAMPGSHCAWCPKLAGCPLREANPYGEMTREDRTRFALWLTAAKKQNDQILKDLVNASGPVEVQDANGQKYRAGFELKERASYPLSCYYTLAANDPELVPKLTIGGLSTPLKAKKRAALRELLEAQKAVTNYTRFAISGADDEDED